MLLQGGETAVPGFVQPDQQTSPFRERAQIEMAVVIDVGGDNGNDPAGKSQNLGRRTGNLDNDVRLGRTRKHHSVQHTVTVEVGID